MLGIKFYAVFIFSLFAGKALGNIEDYRSFSGSNLSFNTVGPYKFVVTLGFIARNIYGLL